MTQLKTRALGLIILGPMLIALAWYFGGNHPTPLLASPGPKNPSTLSATVAIALVSEITHPESGKTIHEILMRDWAGKDFPNQFGWTAKRVDQQQWDATYFTYINAITRAERLDMIWRLKEEDRVMHIQPRNLFALGQLVPSTFGGFIVTDVAQYTCGNTNCSSAKKTTEFGTLPWFRLAVESGRVIATQE